MSRAAFVGRRPNEKPDAASQQQYEDRTSLRRLDWRFLLPLPSDEQFRHLVVLGGPSGIADRLKQTGLARAVTDRPPVSGRVDALAMLHDAPMNLGEAARLLAPGGVFYCEVQRRSVGDIFITPFRVLDRMRKLGLTPSATYLVTPNFDRYRQYVPLDRAGALHWYLTTRYAPQSATQFLLGNALGLLGRLAVPMARALAPTYAVIATLGEAGQGTPAILRHTPLESEPATKSLRPILLTSGIDEGSRVVMLPFGEGLAAPHVVVKVPRSASLNGNIAREQQTLSDIHEQLDLTLQSTIPCPRGVVNHQGLTAGVESFASGRSLLVLSWQWGRPMRDKIDDLRLVAKWLATFHRQSRHDEMTWTGAQLGRRMTRLMDEYAQSFGRSSAEDQLFAAVLGHIEALAGIHVSLTRTHIDFVPANVYRDGSTLTVIDWEDRCFDHSSLGPALTDLLHFATHWNFAVRGIHAEDAQLQSFGQLFLERDRPDRITAAVQNVIADYMAEAEVDSKLYPVLLVYTLVEHALERLNRYRVVGEAETAARSRNRYVAHIGLLADNADNLFRIPTALRTGESHEVSRQ